MENILECCRRDWDCRRHYRDNTRNIEDIGCILMNLTIDDILHIISFLFTIIIILMGVIIGMNNIELVINILYFTTLNITLLRYLVKAKK